MLQKTLFFITLLCLGVVLGSRVRRHLVFSEGSHLFFSVDVRDNLFGFSDFFANVFGCKMDWDLPSKVVHDTSKGRIQRRDLYQGIGNILHRQNLNGSSCIRKFLCEASVILPKSNHFLAQLYEVIFSPNDRDITDTYGIDNSKNQCTDLLEAATECPLSLASVLSGSKPNFNVLFN